MIAELKERLQISFDVYNFYNKEGRGRYVMYTSKRELIRQIDLIYYNGHDTWIKNFSRLFHDITDIKCHYVFCKRCYSKYIRNNNLNSHQDHCSQNDCSVQHILPSPGTRDGKTGPGPLAETGPGLKIQARGPYGPKRA